MTHKVYLENLDMDRKEFKKEMNKHELTAREHHHFGKTPEVSAATIKGKQENLHKFIKSGWGHDKETASAYKAQIVPDKSKASFPTYGNYTSGSHKDYMKEAKQTKEHEQPHWKN